MGQLVEIKKASVRIPAGQISQGGAAGLKRLKGAAEEAAQSTWKRGLVGKGIKEKAGSAVGHIAMFGEDHPVASTGIALGGAGALKLRQKSKSGVAKADRDENSSIGATVVLRAPKVANKATTVHARTGAFAGKSRGVGRHLTRDENSSPGKAVVRTPSLREINGKFAGDGPGVKVFHPRYSTDHRAPRDSRVQRWTKGGDKVSRPWIAKADSEERKGLLGPVDMGFMQHQAGSRVGRRIPLA